MSDEAKQEKKQNPEESKAAEVTDQDLTGIAGGAKPLRPSGFVNFGDIKGESTDKDHKDWVQILG